MSLELHHKAEELRETEKFKEALEVYDKVIEEYLENNNYAGLAEALQGKVLTYKHKYTRKRNEKYLKLAMGCAKSSLAIIKKYKTEDMYASGYFRMGEVYRLANKYRLAVVNFEKACDMSKDKKERGDYLYHLGEALYKNGKKGLGKKKMFDGLKLINKDKNRLDSFIYGVWKSGVYLRLAQIYILEKDKVSAEKYINKVKKMIDSDKRLVIRAKQLKEVRTGKYYW